MGGFLAELGKNLADRWLTLLVLPGALFLATATAAHILGWRHALDVHRLLSEIDRWSAPSTGRSVATVVILLVACLLAAAAVGVAANALGSLVEHLWMSADWQTWPAPLRTLARLRVAQRTRRWDAAYTVYLQRRENAGRARALRHAGGFDRASPAETFAALTVTLHRMHGISPERPGRPTWIGDRVNSVGLRLDRTYGLDIGTAWPHLWLLMSDASRSEITASRTDLTAAANLAAWGLLYLIPGVMWWPGLIIAAAVLLTGRMRARTAVSTYSVLVEAASQLHACDLAEQLGIDHTGPFDHHTGWTITCLLQGRRELIPHLGATSGGISRE